VGEKTAKEKDTSESTPLMLCEWGGSLVEITSTTGTLGETSLLNSSKGVLKVEGGSVTIESSKFDENSPQFTKFPSFRRNVVCGGEAELSVEYLKGGDGSLPNSSLFMKASPDCSVKGTLLKDRPSSFFIPTLTTIAMTEGGGVYRLSFTGTHLFPCTLGFSLLYSSTPSKRKDFGISSLSFTGEEGVVGEVERGDVDGHEEDEIRGVITFSGGVRGMERKMSDGILVRNVGESKGEEGGDKKNEANEGMLIGLIVVVVVCTGLIFLLVMIGVRWVKWKGENKTMKEKMERFTKFEVVGDNLGVRGVEGVGGGDVLAVGGSK
jgi:hypothetical protein